MQLFTICIFTFALAICYIKANEHSPHHASTSIAPDVSDRKKREDGPPHPTPRERRSIREKRQVPPNEPVTMHTPSPSRRKRNSEATSTTHMVHPVMEQADEMAEAIEESESAGVKKRETEETMNSSNDAEGESTTTMTTEITLEKKEGDEEIEVTASEDSVQAQIPRAKRVSHAGSSHKNRPSAVNRLQSNSNVGGNEEEEEEQKDHEPEHEDVHHHDYEFDHIHTY
uniref:Uncharacterized protein n=1 Tax=Panagrolaimus superbus TaxID=310955 RepID=A0A914YWP6_9BILA